MSSTPHARVRVASEELRAEVDALRAHLEPAVEPAFGHPNSAGLPPCIDRDQLVL